MHLARTLALLVAFSGTNSLAADNQLSPAEKQAGWVLLFDGSTLAGWTTNTGQPSKRPVEEHSLNPHRSGGYMLIHEKQWGDFILSLDFKIAKGTNSGVFIRTSPLEPRPGKDVGYNGLEVAIDDTTTAGFHDTGAIYDLVPASTNAMHPVGEWNHLQINCDKNLISVEVNGKPVSRIDLDQWTEKNKRADGTAHKFDVVYKDHPRSGYLGLQDHGGNVWYKNIKLKPLGGK